MFLSTLDSLLEAGALADDPTNTVDGWQAYCDWSEAVGQDFEIPEPTPTPARRFAPGEVMPWMDARCPVCGFDCGDAAVCEKCMRDAETVDALCDVCGEPGADRFAGLCVTHANEYHDEADRTRRRLVAIQDRIDAVQGRIADLQARFH